MTTVIEIRNESMPKALVPYLEHYFGRWMMLEDQFVSLAEQVKRLDLQSHLASDAVTEARAAAERQSDPQMEEGGIAVVALTGTLMKHCSSFSRGTSTVAARQAIRKAARDPECHAIVLKIDSPGGTVAGGSDLGDEIYEANQSKPVYAYIEDVGASGAYWAASQAREIHANANAVVGSIGTFAVVQDMSAQAAQLGVKVHVVRAGKMKGVGVPGAEISAEQLGALQEEINELNEIFLEAVSRGRGMPLEKVRELADGRVHVGAKARDVGLIDVVGSFDSLLQKIRTGSSPMAKPESTVQVSLQVEPKAADITPPNKTAPPPLTADEIQKQIQEGIAKGQADERQRCSEIRALCDKAKRPQLAAKFIADGTDVAKVQSELFTALCEDNPTVGDAGGGDRAGGRTEKDPDADFKREYAAGRETYLRMGVDEEAYLRTRRIDEAGGFLPADLLNGKRQKQQQPA